MKEDSRIQIEDYDEQYRDQLYDLHRQIFLSVDGGVERYKSSQERLEQEIDSLRTVIVTKADKLIGFGICGPLKDIPPYSDRSPFIEEIQNQLDWGRCPEEKDLLLQHMKKDQEEMGGKAVVRFYDNDFTRSKYQAVDTDYYFTDIGVVPEYRGRGIGMELIKRRIAIARSGNASAIFVMCWNGGNVSRLYRRLDFHPILKAGPSYYDGNAAKLMGKFIKR